MSATNWGGGYAYEAQRVHRPTTVGQLQETVAAARRVRVIGTRHSFNGIADSTELVSLAGLPADVLVDDTASTVSCPAGLKYGHLALALVPHGLALHNLASLADVSVGGAVTTATHGSGDRNGNLATAVSGLEVVTGTGEIMTARRGDADFDGMVVGLGAIGAITRVTLDVEPLYEVSQTVFDGLAWETLDEYLDDITAAGDSVSLFTSWGSSVEQVWVKSRVTDGRAEARSDLFGASAATAPRHPIPGLDPAECSVQLGAVGLWSERLPHFPLGFTAGQGEEIQSELHVPRRHARACVDALRGLTELIRPILVVSEIRTAAADRLWMSPQNGQDTVSFHFTWKLQPEAVRTAVAAIEGALEPYEPRPHWGKLFSAGSPEVGARYERRTDFLDLVGRLDPRHVFRNEWFETHVIPR